MDARGRDERRDRRRRQCGRAAMRRTIAGAKTLILGSHYDTVRNAGQYDGRLGILTGAGGGRAPAPVRPQAAVPRRRDRVLRGGGRAVRHALHRQQRDRRQVRRRRARAARRRRATAWSTSCATAGLDPQAFPALARRPQDLLGYLEVHIEQGPVLLHENLPVGIVTSIAGDVRHARERSPARRAMPAPCRWRCAATPPPPPPRSCSTSSGAAPRRRRWSAPSASSRCRVARSTSFPAAASSRSTSAPATTQTRDAAVSDVLAEIERIAERRNVAIETTEVIARGRQRAV